MRYIAKDFNRVPPPRRSSKYGSRRAMRNGFGFDSEKEAKYFDQLTIRQKAGDIMGFLWQVPLRMPGNVTYWCDFQVFEKDGSVHWVDTKGFKTAMYKTKLRLVNHYFPWIIIEER